mgnify:CR=1 FL=1
MKDEIEQHLKDQMSRAGKRAAARLQARLAKKGRSKQGGFPHKQSGRLERSIDFRVDGLTLSIGSDLGGYPQFLETGTRYMASRPWETLFAKEDLQRIRKDITG